VATCRNTDGRNEIDVLWNGPEQPSIPKKHDPSYRVLHITCDARVEGGEHTLRFVARDIAAKKWADSKTGRVTTTEWTGLDAYLRVPSTSDLAFRIDDEQVSAAPSSVFIKNIKITEEK